MTKPERLLRVVALLIGIGGGLCIGAFSQWLLFKAPNRSVHEALFQWPILWLLYLILALGLAEHTFRLLVTWTSE
jgi:hypothetical protein